MARHKTATGTPTLSRATILERLAGLMDEDKVLLDPAALFREPFSLPPGPAVCLPERPGRLHLVEQLDGLWQAELPEMVSADLIAACLERPGPEALDPRYLPFDHPEGIMARFNRWFYSGQAERAFGEGHVPTALATDHLLARAEARLLARLAHRSGNRKPTVLKLGAGCEVSPLRLIFEELGRLDAALSEGCKIIFSDISASLVEEATRRARSEVVLSQLLERGQLRFQVLDASRPELAGDKFTLVHSAYLYDSMPQRELARVGGRWYEFKARPQIAGWPELEDFRRLLLSDDLERLHEVDTHLFGYLGWQVVLDPLAPEDVPHRELLEEICPGAGELAVPLGEALVAGFEALLPHLAPGGAIQTFDLGIPEPTDDASELKGRFRGPKRITGALIMGQNFALARKVFDGRGLQTSLLPPDRYLEEMLGEEVIELEQLWAALSEEALRDLLGAEFVARYRSCLEGEGGRIFRQAAEGNFLTRAEAEKMRVELEALGLDGRGFVEGLFAARERLTDEGAYEQFRVEFA